MSTQSAGERVEKVVPASAAEVVQTFDHALLQPTLSDAEFRREIEELRQYPIASVCVKPYAVSDAVDLLHGTQIAVGTVIGFPHGTQLPEVKLMEAKLAFEQGAADIDVVVNTGKVLSDEWGYVREELAPLVLLTRESKGVIKVIFETDFLQEDRHKIRLCEICAELQVDYVKTSTGFGFVKRGDAFRYEGATEHDVELMRRYSGAHVGVKPSGGVRTLERVLRFLDLGATRIGTASTAHIYKEALNYFGH